MQAGAVRLIRALANPTNEALLIALESGPSYPRALATSLGMSEGHVQKHLRALEQHGLVEGAWHHEGKTVKRYALRARSVELRFDHHDIEAALAVGSKADRARD